MAIKTGRSRTITITGNLTGTTGYAGATGDGLPPPGTPNDSLRDPLTLDLTPQKESLQAVGMQRAKITGRNV